jgi:hypothetical protein
MEIGKVRKFYQQMLVRFTPSGSGTVRHWSISNWGPLAEAPWNRGGDLKGGLKSETQASYLMAQEANKRQVAAKIKGGYTHYSEFTVGAKVDPPPRLRAELRMTLDRMPDVAKPTPETKARWPSLESIQASVTLTSKSAMECLINDNLSEAIRLRQVLIEMSDDIRSLHESTQGQLEMLTLKLTAELMK